VLHSIRQAADLQGRRSLVAPAVPAVLRTQDTRLAEGRGCYSGEDTLEVGDTVLAVVLVVVDNALPEKEDKGCYPEGDILALEGTGLVVVVVVGNVLPGEDMGCYSEAGILEAGDIVLPEEEGIAPEEDTVDYTSRIRILFLSSQ